MADDLQVKDGAIAALSLLQEDFLHVLHRLIQTAKIHDDNSRLLLELAAEFVQILRRIGAYTDEIILQISGQRVFLQSEKVPYLNRNAALLNQVVDLLERLELPGLRFYSRVLEITPAEVLALTRLLLVAEREPFPLLYLADQVPAKFSWVAVIQEEANFAEAGLERRERGLRTYSQAIFSLQDVTQKITARKSVGIRKAVRVAQKMVDLILADEPVLIGMSTIRDYDDYTHTHSVNVAILAMCLGARIHLSPASLEKLGICGLFHDLGKVDIPLEIINKEGRLTAEEFEEIKHHSLNSVRQILRLHAPQGMKARILLPPFEHHLKYDLSGYPRTSRNKPLSLFGRILALADVFDAITSPRKYRPTALSADRAIRLMMEGAGKDFDPILLKVFINMVGPYPVGTLLELRNNQLGLVIKSTGKRVKERLRPAVVLLEADGAGGYRKGAVIDLGERDAGTGDFKHHIKQSMNPAIYGIQPADFIF
ncbi:MAG: hypothetical protein COX17_04410 [Deltaproteobacteria bacterium CG23_combo_of_CG06-09_8_20_14_all_60_8]|nr:MAG: hypothetical protein COX17_04410 [Deltaproteobacteria bacterium CG23_combo_of_CG06-09_8_20_14_all_60_8]